MWFLLLFVQQSVCHVFLGVCFGVVGGGCFAFLVVVWGCFLIDFVLAEWVFSLVFFFHFVFLNQTMHTFRDQEQRLAAKIPQHLQIMEAILSKYQFFSCLAQTGS